MSRDFLFAALGLWSGKYLTARIGVVSLEGNDSVDECTVFGVRFTQELLVSLTTVRYLPKIDIIITIIIFLLDFECKKKLAALEDQPASAGPCAPQAKKADVDIVNVTFVMTSLWILEDRRQQVL